jgi:hypothetical protein
MDYNKIYNKYQKYKEKYSLVQTKSKMMSFSDISMINSIIQNNILLLYAFFKNKFNYDILLIKADLINSIKNKPIQTQLFIDELKDKYNISRYIINYFSDTFRIKKCNNIYTNLTFIENLNLESNSAYKDISKFTTFDGVYNYVASISNNNSYINFDEYLLLELQKNNILMDIIRYKNYPQYLLNTDSNEIVLDKILSDKPFIIVPLQI